MDFNQILNQVLNVAKETVINTKNGNSTQDKVAKIGGGAAAIGILSMILGRNGGSNLAKLGSLAALGSLAYQAYQTYQAKNAQNSTELTEAQFTTTEANESQIVLQAMISAAAADGVITEAEKQTLFAEAGDNAELQQWLEHAITQPATPAQLATLVGNNPALAAQVYLAARMVCQELDRKEIIFLANLAQALGLDDALVEQLEKQAGF